MGLDCETKWFKLLGMCLDNQLSWVGQRARVYQKAVAGTFMLAHLKRAVPHIIRLMICNSLTWPYFEYCIKVWGCTKLLKMCVRHILGAGYRQSWTQFFERCQLWQIVMFIHGFLVCVTHKLFVIVESSVDINSIFLNHRRRHIINEEISSFFYFFYFFPFCQWGWAMQPL